MPELPEVETIRRDLENEIIGKKIIDIKVIQNKSIRNSSSQFIHALQNKTIESINRKGKLLILKIKDNNFYLLVHLRMTGQLIFSQSDAQSETAFFNNHTRAFICFEDGSKLFFNDTRRFGYLQITTEKEKNGILDKMGFDLLDKNFSFNKLKNMFQNKKRNLKSILLDQKMIAGIGNIYADEICFDARLRPDVKINTLNDKEIKKLYNSIMKIIKLAIKNRGTTFNDYRDSRGKKGNFSRHLKVYQKENDVCQNCHQKSIKKMKISGRSTRYCDNCQK